MTSVSIVENQPTEAENLARFCSSNNRKVIGIYHTGESFLQDFEKNRPDLIIIDINLHEGLAGINAMRKLDLEGISVIYLLSTKDPFIISSAFETQAKAVIIKPIHENELRYVLEASLPVASKEVPVHTRTVKNSIFIKDEHQYVKVKTQDILYIQADRCYTEIFTAKKKYVTTESLNHFEDVLPRGNFGRIHRSWIVNMEYIDALEEGRLKVHSRMIPIGKTYRKKVRNMLNII